MKKALITTLMIILLPYMNLSSRCVSTLSLPSVICQRYFNLKNYNKTALTLLGVYLGEMRIYANTKTCTQMFIAALFVTDKTQKQPERSSIGE